MTVIVDTNNNLVSITGLTVEQRVMINIIELDGSLDLNWKEGKSGWSILCMNWKQVCQLSQKINTMLQSACDIWEAFEVALETRIEN